MILEDMSAEERENRLEEIKFEKLKYSRSEKVIILVAIIAWLIFMIGIDMSVEDIITIIKGEKK